MQGPRKQVTAFAGYGTVNKTPLQGRDIRTRSINGTRNLGLGELHQWVAGTPAHPGGKSQQPQRRRLPLEQAIKEEIMFCLQRLSAPLGPAYAPSKVQLERNR